MQSTLWTQLALLGIVLTGAASGVIAHSQWRRCGVVDRSSRWLFAYVVVMGALIVAVHVVAMIALASGVRCVQPVVIAAAYPLVSAGLLLALQRLARRSIGLNDERGVGHGVGHGSAAWPLRVRRRRAWLAIPLAVLVCTYAVFLMDASTRFPTGWDGVHYHLPLAVHWVQSGMMDIVPSGLVYNYPNNGTILSYLLLAGGWQRLTSVVMVPQVVLLVLCVFSLGRVLGLGHRDRIVAVCLVTSIPMVLYQTFSSYIDLFAAVAWLASLSALFHASRCRRDGERPLLVFLAGLACGIALGSKLTYLALGGMLGVVAVILPWIGRRAGRPSARMAFQLGLTFTVAVLLCSGYWFIRNTVRTGNPIYPLALTIGDWTLFAGAKVDEFFPERTISQIIGRWLTYPWTEFRATGYNYGVGDGLGAAFAAFVPAGLVGGMVMICRRGAWSIRRGHQTIALIMVMMGIVLFGTCFHQTLRFVLPLIVLAAICAVAPFSGMLRQRPRWSLAVLTASLAVTGVVAVLMPAKDFAGRIRDGVWSRMAFYETPAVIDSLPPGSAIVNVNSHTRNFALAGDRLEHRVISPLQWERASLRAPSKAQALKELGATFVFVSGEATDWIEADGLELAYDSTVMQERIGGQRLRIFRVIDDPPRPAPKPSTAESAPSPLAESDFPSVKPCRRARGWAIQDLNL